MWKKRGRKPRPRYSDPSKGIAGGGKYGITWWGQKWLQVFDQISFDNRLPRGRTYANQGAVRSIVQVDNQIIAIVKGSFPYQVIIELPLFKEKEIQAISRLASDRPDLVAQLLNQTMPPELLQWCEDQGVKLFPVSWKNLSASCSCPDFAVPCKHIAAVIYLFANEIDKNPFRIFDLHGYDLRKALKRIGSVSGDAAQPVTSLADLLQPLDDAPETPFQFEPERLEKLNFFNIPDCRKDLISILTPKPVFFPNGDFRAALEKALAEVGKKLSSLPSTEPEYPENLNSYLAAEILEVRLNAYGMPVDFSAWDDQEKLLFKAKKPQHWIDWLSGIPPGNIELLPDELRAHWLAWRFAEALAIKGAIIPQILQSPDGAYIIRWLPALLQEEVLEKYYQFLPCCPSFLVNLEWDGELYLPKQEESGLFLLSLYLNIFVKAHNEQDLTEFNNFFFRGEALAFSRFTETSIPQSIQQWLKRYYLSAKDLAPVFEVDETGEGLEVRIWIENKKKPLSAPVPLSEVLSGKKYRKEALNILQDLNLLADHFPDIKSLLANRELKTLRYNLEDFAKILFDTLPLIRLYGIRILLPRALSRLLKPQASLRFDGDPGKLKQTSFLSLDKILTYQWEVAVGDTTIDLNAFKKLLKEGRSLVKIRDEYMYLDSQDARRLLEKLEKPPQLNHFQLFQASIAQDYEGIPVKLTQALQDRIRQLLEVDQLPVPQGIHANLRPYQQRGFSWIAKNAQLGFGSILADDMGLGKTLQVITAMQHFLEKGQLSATDKALIVMPTTLLTNWTREIARFAPELKSTVYHGPGRSLEQTEDAHLVLTSYGVVRSDHKILEKKPWFALVIDESQNIKNPGTEQTKALKKISAQVRIALSGTPVENRLSEYWSVFDFTNKGYLDNLKRFLNHYAYPIEKYRDQATLERFRKITSPFVMRRVKTDKSILSDLPDKVERNQFCTLSKEQAALYQSVLDATMKKISDSEGIERSGLVLSLILQLKQICNHPAHFLKKGPYQAELSGKCPLLLELLDQAMANQEKTLIFTQFREMGEILAPMIQERFGLTPDFLHGGVQRKYRDEMVDQFQNSHAHPILLLSLKAGGTGLNLTAASQVIHFDLWWNPAVEAQATDRAYRIGQHRNVQVHRFITSQTFEERIDAMIQNKKELASLTVRTGENWIGDLPDQELQKLFQLG